MKLIFQAVLVVYIYSADSREVPDKPDKWNLTSTDETLELNGKSLEEGKTETEMNNRDTQTIQLIKSLTRKFKKLDKKLESMENNLNTKLGSMENNLAQDNLEIKTEVGSMENNLNTKLGSMENNLTQDNSEIKTELGFIENDLGSIETKLELHIAANKARLRHFPYAKYKKTWEAAKTYCESIGGQLWTPVDKAETIAAYNICGTLCWNGWHKIGDQWVTVSGEVKSSNFWANDEPESSDDAAWSYKEGIYGRSKNDLYGWTCEMINHSVQ